MCVCACVPLCVHMKAATFMTPHKHPKTYHDALQRTALTLVTHMSNKKDLISIIIAIIVGNNRGTARACQRPLAPSARARATAAPFFPLSRTFLPRIFGHDSHQAFSDLQSNMQFAISCTQRPKCSHACKAHTPLLSFHDRPPCANTFERSSTN